MLIPTSRRGKLRNITCLLRKSQRSILKSSNLLHGGDKKDDFKQGRMFGRVAKIPIANTPNELAAVDFADYGDFATFLHIQATLSRISAIIFMGTKKKEEQKAGAVRVEAIPNWSAVFGAPGIIVLDKDSRFNGEFCKNFAPPAI